MGAARGREPRAGHAGAGAVRAAGPHGERARRCAGGDRAVVRRLGAEEARRRDGRGGARGPRAALRPGHGHRRPLRARRRRQRGADPGRRGRPWRDRSGEVPAALARRGGPGPREGDRHLLDLHGRARPQRLDIHRAHRRLYRRRRGRGDVGGDRLALGPAARRRAGTRHSDDRRGCRDGRPGEMGRRPPGPRRPDHGLRPPGVPGGGPTGAPSRTHGGGARLAPRGDREGARVRRARRARPAPSGASSRDERRVLGGRRARRRRHPGEAHAGDVRVRAGWPGGRRTFSSRSASGGSSGPRPATSAQTPARSTPYEPRRGGGRGRRPRPGRRRSARSPRFAPSGTTSSRQPRATPTTARGRRRTGRSRSSGSARSSSCCAAGSRTRARPRAARRSSRSKASRGTTRAT